MRRITVSATLFMLKREGIVTYSRGLMTIKYPAQLARYGNEGHLRTLEAFVSQDELEKMMNPS